MPDRGLGFAQAVAPGGYAWWYVDALSDDGRNALTLIAFVGSVFSPYYARARKRQEGDPLHYCALNVALYGGEGKRWALTERGRAVVRRTHDALAIGPSMLAWDGSALTIDIDEVTAPLPSRIRGRVRLHPRALVDRTFALDAAQRHRWSPLAPDARVEVALERPALRWAGAGYLDSNAGDAPLENAFSGWHWSRAHRAGGSSVLYDVVRRDGGHVSLALQFDSAGGIRAFSPPPVAPLPQTGWRVARATRSEVESAAKVLTTLEDTPFYARSLISAHLHGAPVTAVHESLSLDRFRSGWVQMLLPFRMPRAWR
jgi:carotenoid 1,2-hydratase